MKQKTFEEIGFLNIAVLVLTIYVLGAIIIDTVFTLSDETSKLLNYIDIYICVFFFFEFCLRFFKSKNKLHFLHWGWIDLISSIPLISALRVGRIFRLLRIIRIIRAFRSFRSFIYYLFRNKAQGTLTSVAIFAILVVFFQLLQYFKLKMPMTAI